MASVLEDAAEGAAAAGEADPYLSALARDVFAGMGFRFSSLCVTADENGRTLLEVFCTGLPRQPDYNLLLDRLREKTNVGFMPPVQDEYKKEGVVLSFCERAALKPEFYKRSAAAAGENLCGDTVEAFADGKGRFFCVLSDGMGTGKTAALDSVMTCTLFSRLLRTGFAPETALAAVNCALMVKQGEETLATLDLLSLDLYTGQADFYKAGGAVSVVQKGGRTAVVEQSSLPLGIVQETRFARTGMSLSAGDTVLMLSDGAGMLTPEYFKGVLYQHRESDAKTLCETVLAEAVSRAPAGRRDDITVACVRIREF
jgi:stage II sporulation protein E